LAAEQNPTSQASKIFDKAEKSQDDNFIE
jgi:hypothetical protein